MVSNRIGKRSSLERRIMVAGEENKIMNKSDLVHGASHKTRTTVAGVLHNKFT
jgi:hypothetical protein